MAEKSKTKSATELKDPEDSDGGEDGGSSLGKEECSETGRKSNIFWPEEPLYFLPNDDDGEERSKRRASQDLHEESLRLLRIKIAVTDIPKLMSFRLDQLLIILRKHPLGLKKNSLFKYYRNCFNMNDTNLGSIFQELLERNDGSIVTKKVPGVGELYFVAESGIDLKEVLTFFAQQLLQLAICEGGKVSARSAVSKLLEICSVSFDVKDWGLDISQFVKIILSVSPSGRLHLIPYDGEDQDESHPGEDYIFVQDSGNEEVDAIVRAHLMDISEVASLPLHPIETCYVKFGEKLDNHGMLITEGLVLACKLYQINSIIDFYVIICDYWNQMEAVQTVVNNRYTDGSGVDLGSPPPPVPLKYLVPGTVVTCFQEEEWHRVEILAYNPKRRTCRVRSLELGLCWNDVDPKDLRMLGREMLKEMPSHGIHCGLCLPEPFNAKKSQLFPRRSHESSQSAVILNQVVSNKLVYVTFRNFVPVHDAVNSSGSEGYMWEVDMAMGTKDGEFVKCEAGKEDLAEHLINKFKSDTVLNRMFT